MKKIHVLASGANPTSAQAADGMAALQGLYVELIGQGSLGRLYDVLATSDVTAREWTRIRASAGVVVTLPTTITAAIASSWPYGYPGYDYDGPDYGWWYVDGFCNYPRPPFNLAPIVVIDSTGAETCNIYVADKGAWVDVNAVAQQDAFPFGPQLVEGFKALLAERWVDDWDQQLGASTQRQAAYCRSALSMKFDSASRPARASYF